MNETTQTPAWYTRLAARYLGGEAHTFVLHLNVADYAVPGVPVAEYLEARFAASHLVIRYDLAGGVRFSTPAMADLAQQILGADRPAAAPPPDNPFLASLATLQGPAGAATEFPREPAGAFAAIERLLTFAGDHPRLPGETVQVSLIVEYAEALFPAGDWPTMRDADRTLLVTLQRWATDPRIANLGHKIAILTRNLADLHPAVRAATARIEAIEVPYPAREARLAYIAHYRAALGDEVAWTIDPAALASASAGLALIHLEDILRRARTAGAITPELVRERKREIIDAEFAELLEIVEPRFGFERIGGSEHLKRFFANAVIRPLREGRTARVPKGVLLSGPPGTGKSLMAEAVACEAGINFVYLRMGKILGQYVGTSERNLEKALRAIKALAPVGVVIEEIDQSTPGRSQGAGDSGVGSRVFGRILEFMADPENRGRVIFLANTNRPDLLDPAMRRPGRFDKKIPFLVPDRDERAGILAVLAGRAGLAATGEALAGIAASTENWTGAELEALVIKAVETVEDEGAAPEEALRHAARTLTPSTADIERLSEIAIRECNDRDLLPPRLRDRPAPAPEPVSPVAPARRAARTLN